MNQSDIPAGTTSAPNPSGELERPGENTTIPNPAIPNAALQVAPAPEGGPERRAQLTRDIMLRTGISEALIERLVRRFYGQVREDPMLGPVFAARVTDWEAHIVTLCAFWSSVALMTGRYHGRPMPAHAGLPVSGAHFDRWLDLFEATACDICPPAAAAHVIERARRIADSLEMGIAVTRGEFHTPRHRDRGPLPGQASD